MLANRRKAYASRGDDMRTRFVKEPGFHQSGNKVAKMPADATGTRFVNRILPPDKNILVSGHSNIKLGKTVRKGALRGYDIYQLSLEERKTCPTSCQHWQNCYGNASPLAKRVDHTYPTFLPLLEAAVAEKCRLAKKRGSGILVRLHALGDFYSVDYVRFWRGMLIKHENLAVYGYTARDPLSVIGMHIQSLATIRRRCSMIRFSNGGMANMATVSIGRADSCPSNAFVCPEQTGKTLGCDTCGLCWGTEKNVAFLEH